jgi:hypothetical protein
MSDKIINSALKNLLLLPLSSFLHFYENKQNLGGNIYPKHVKFKTIGQSEKIFLKKKKRAKIKKQSFQYLHRDRKENLTLFTRLAILDENLNY